MTKIKICGIRRAEDARAAISAGTDMLGFVFAESPRQVEPEAVRAVVAEIRELADVITVGVFVNDNVERMHEVKEFCDLDWIQLSGNEHDDEIARIDAPVVKTVHVGGVSSDELATRLETCPAEMVLLDSRHETLRGGTGVAFDWRLVPESTKRLLVGGGLRPETVSRAIRTARPWGVDVSSGVETAGWKDSEKIRAFVRAVRQADEAPAP